MVAPARQLSDRNVGGTGLGQATSDLISFYGVTPISQPTSAALTATASLWVMTGASFVANTSTTVSGLFGFNSTLAAQFFDALIAMRSALVNLGLHKGGA